MTGLEKEALEYVDMMRQNRSNAAHHIMENRRFIRETLSATEVEPELRLKLLHLYAKGVDKRFRNMMKPSPENLLQEAKYLLAYSRSPWHNPYDSEYYSA